MDFLLGASDLAHGSNLSPQVTVTFWVLMTQRLAVCHSHAEERDMEYGTLKLLLLGSAVETSQSQQKTS